MRRDEGRLSKIIKKALLIIILFYIAELLFAGLIANTGIEYLGIFFVVSGIILTYLLYKYIPRVVWYIKTVPQRRRERTEMKKFMKDYKRNYK